jgi:hypothetical protein
MGLTSEYIGGRIWQDVTNLTDEWDLKVSTSVAAFGRIKPSRPIDGTYK